jgi:dihydroorotate dehydrogenase
MVALQFGSDPQLLDELVRTAKRTAARPLIVKLSPNVTSIGLMAHVAEEAGADAISLVNTFSGDGDRRRDAAAADCQCDGRDSPGRRSSRLRCAWFMTRRRR